LNYKSTVQRRKAIKELITSQAVENQVMLVQLLKEKYDITSNQSIVSRDLQEMGISKKKYKDVMIYEMQEVDPSKEILRLGILNIEHNEVIMIVTVLPGLAAFVGDYLDSEREELGVIGTMAGENMIFVVPTSIKIIEEVYKKVCLFLFFKKTER
jgi:transcriptional regulator of arginine metabolism